MAYIRVIGALLGLLQMLQGYSVELGTAVMLHGSSAVRHCTKGEENIYFLESNNPTVRAGNNHGISNPNFRVRRRVGPRLSVASRN